MTAVHDLPPKTCWPPASARCPRGGHAGCAGTHGALGAPHPRHLLRPEHARWQVPDQSEARWLRGEPQGLLDGVPVTIKENIATQGDPTPLGTAAVPLVPGAADAPPPPACAKRGRDGGQNHHARLRHAVLRACRAFTPCRATRGM